MKEVSPGHFVRTDAPKRSAAPKPDTDRLTYIIPASEFNDSPQTTGAPESVRNAVPINVYLIIAIVIFIASVIATALILTAGTPSRTVRDADMRTQYTVCADDAAAGHLSAISLTETEADAK